jgi:putative transcriptional regulator
LHIPEKVDVAAVRGRTGLSQWAFARRIGVSPATLRNWEQGRRRPEGPARVLLAMLDRNPRIVEETLARSDLARPDEGPAAQSASSTAPAGGRS